MKGANTEPSVKTINVPKRTKNKAMGINQYFLRILRKFQNSTIIESFDIFIPFC